MNRKELYILAIITFLTVSVWIMFGLYNAKKTTTIQNTDIKIVPLTPTFDNDIINQLNQRGDF